MSKTTIRVLIVDDQASVRKGVRARLATGFRRFPLAWPDCVDSLLRGVYSRRSAPRERAPAG